MSKSKGFFKQVLKIFGIACLCAVILVGVVTAFLAIRGDFKKKKINPTSISFNVPLMNLVYNSDVDIDAENPYPSFTISAEPLDITETKCVITVSDPNLITFKRFADGEWKDYDSSVFYLNEPIYFEINNIESNHIVGEWDNYYNVQNPTTDYFDGVLTITVKDSSGMLQTSMTMEIDRNVKSISLKDFYNDKNNQVKNGEFYYEQNVENGEEIVQTIDAIINQDYELNVVTAPLMSLKPFADRDAKIYEIYYMEAETPKLLTHVGDKVQLKVVVNEGFVYENCSFLRYDEDKNIYILNSSETKQYDFMLAVYENYEIQKEYADREDLTLAERLTHMLKKKVSIIVSGTEAHNIEFRTDSNSFDLNLFQNNQLVLSDNSSELFNLGLTLTKNNSDNTAGAEITGRFNEVEFLDDESFSGQIVWNLRAGEIVAGTEFDSKIYRDVMISIYEGKKAKITGLSSIAGLADITDAIEFDVSLVYSSSANLFTLTLTKLMVGVDGGETNYTIEFKLCPQVSGGRLLNIVKLEGSKYMTIKRDGVEISGYDDIVYDDKTNIGNYLIYTNIDSATGNSEFKTLKEGVYLAFLDNDLNNLNSKFATSIESKDGRNNIVNIKPLDSSIISTAKNLYAIVVNKDGQCAYTDNEGFLRVNINYSTTDLYVMNDGMLGLPIIVTQDEMTYETKLDVNTFVGTKNGSYEGVGALLFAPKYYYSLLDSKPLDWDTNWTNYFGCNNGSYFKLSDGKVPEFANNLYYELIHNYYNFIDSVRYKDSRGVEYFLLGQIDANGKFENAIVPTALNKKSILYPLVPQVRYLTEYNRVQTANEYVDELLKSSNVLTDLTDAINLIYDQAMGSFVESSDLVRISYDSTLMAGRRIYKYIYDIDHSEYVAQDNFYNIQSAVRADGKVVITAVMIDKNGLETETIENFIITEENHINNVYLKIKVNPVIFAVSDDMKNKQISTYTYYNVDNIEIQTGFNGSYFEVFDNKNGDDYYVIEDYLNIDESIKHPEDDTIALKDLLARVYINFDWKLFSLGKEVLSNINNKITTEIQKFNASGLLMGRIVDTASLMHQNLEEAQSYIALTEMYDSVPAYEPTITYARYEDDKFVKIYEGQEEPDNWEEEWVNYRVVVKNSLSATINPKFTLKEGEYVKIKFIYSAGSYSKSWVTPKLHIKSRAVQKYFISTEKLVYSANLVTDESAPTSWLDKTQKYYEFNESTHTYNELVEKPEYAKNTYYTLNNQEIYTGVVQYNLVIKYNTEKGKYEYDVYLTDYNGKYLYYIDELDGVYRAVEISADMAFKPKSEGGWILFEPYYANNTDYIITGNDYIQFGGNDGLDLISAKVSGGYQDVILKNISTGLSFEISVNVIADGNFEFVDFTTISSNNKTATITPVYTYNGSNIASALNAKIIEASGYIRVSDIEWVNPSDTNDMITLTKSGSTWSLARSKYINTIVKIEFESNIGNKNCVVEFNNPYDVLKSTQNDTKVIYSGTKFEIAYYTDDKAAKHNLNYVYSIIDKSKEGFTIKYYNGETKLGEVSNKNVENNVISIKVPSVDFEQEIEFRVIFNDEIIDTFKLTIAPNRFIIEDDTSIIELDDGKNSTHDFNPLKIYKYNEGLTYRQYGKYVPTEFGAGVYEYVNGKYEVTKDTEAQTDKVYYADAWEEVSSSVTRSYEGATYLDEDCTKLYPTNVATITDGVLSVNSPISDVRTYFIKVIIKAGGVAVGEVKCKVESTSSIEVNKIDIIANQSQTITMEQFKAECNLNSSHKIVDLLWLEYTNTNLVVRYNYSNKSNKIALDQTNNSMTYKGVLYEFIGKSYNWGNYIYSEAIDGSRKVTDGSGNIVTTNEIGENIIQAGQSFYCIKNAYLFRAGDEILAISAESSGKKVYTISLYNDGWSYMCSPMEKLESIEFTYNGFGDTSQIDSDIVDSIEYCAEFIVDINDTKHNIRTNKTYAIDVTPYKLPVNYDKVLIAGESSSLLDEGNAGGGLFAKTDRVAEIQFSNNDDVKITHYGTKYTITPLAKGNHYTTKLKITLIYSDSNNTTYSYYEDILVYNKQAVGITYPYNTDNELFNANVSDLTNSVNTGAEYDTADLLDWLGKDSFKFDLALRGDTINLVNDELFDIQRYATYSRLTKSTIYAANKYYSYNNGKYSLLKEPNEPDGWNEYWNFYVMEQSSAPLKIELVAVSSGLANSLSQVKANINIGPGVISILDSFEYTGYLAFKVYIENSNTSAYGYYMIKVVDDDNFSMVRNAENGRNTQQLSKSLTSAQGILNVIRTSGYDIPQVAHISNYLVDNKDIYLFALNDFVSEDGIKHLKGELLNSEVKLISRVSTQNVKVAIVMLYGTSLVHLCNYEIVLQSTTTADPTDAILSTIDSNYHIYQAVGIEYIYSNSETTDYDLSTYLEVKANGTEIALESVDVIENETVGTKVLTNSSNMRVNEDVVMYGEKEIAKTIEIEEGVWKLKLSSGISTEEYFYLKLTYENGFVAYLRININPYDDFKPENVSIDVGQYDRNTNKFNTKLALSELIGLYNQPVETSYSNNKNDFSKTSEKVEYKKDSRELEFIQTSEVQTVYIKVELTDIADPITKIYRFNIGAGITDIYYNESNEGKTLEKPVKTTMNTEFSEIGSALYIMIKGNQLRIQKNEGGEDYATIYTSNAISKVEFALKGAQSATNCNEYFVGGASFTESREMCFVHSAKDITFRLSIVITNEGDLTYTEKIIYITIPETYELASVYRVNGEGDEARTAHYETVVAGSKLLVSQTQVEELQDITKNLFGTFKTHSIQHVMESRFAIKFKANDTTHYGYDKFIKLGLYSDGNPNKLSLSFDTNTDMDSVELTNNELVFKLEGNVTICLNSDTLSDSVKYEFRVMTKESDFNNITFNNELIRIDSDEDHDIDYISVTVNQLNEEQFVLATYPYLVTGIDGQVGWADTKLITGSGTLKFKIDNSTASLKNRVIVDELSNLNPEFNKFKVNIITMNGVARSIELVVTNYNAEYGYDGDSYETLYANTEGYKFTDVTTSGNPRMTLTNGASDATYNILTHLNEASRNYVQNNSYSFEWLGIANTVINSIESGIKLNATGLAIYDTADGTFRLKSVNTTTYITMVFNVKYDDYIIGRALYSLCVENDIKIGMNGLSDNESTIDLYLGSYYPSGSQGTTKINLLAKEEVIGGRTYYNNVFITLERFSDGYTIDKDKALYNGDESQLLYAVAANYLTFNIEEDEKFDKKFDIDDKGNLTVFGNPSTSIQLIVGSKGVIGYYRTFTIRVHPVATVEAKWNDSRKTAPNKTEDEIHLFETNNKNYDINAYLTKYNGKEIDNLALSGKDYYEVSYQIFNIDTSIATIKNTTEGWKEVELESGKVNLPQVPYSRGDNDKYYIVSYKVTLTLNGDAEDYYAHYTVYNPSTITINDYYLNNENVITYADKNDKDVFVGAWDSGNTITIMDANNKGMYSAFEAVELSAKPTDDSIKYYIKNNDGTYSLKEWKEEDEFVEGTYYKLNGVIQGVIKDKSRFKFRFETPKLIKDGKVEAVEGTLSEDHLTLTATLPKGMFENSSSMTFKLVDGLSENVIFSSEWTIKSNTELKAHPDGTLRLSELFLRGEIGEELYTEDIVGIIGKFDATTALKWISGNPTSVTCSAEAEPISRGSITYSIYKITYQGSVIDDVDAASVFTNKAEFYILTGSDYAVGFNYNGGNYYINIIVDDQDQNNGYINLTDYVKLYYMNNDKIAKYNPTNAVYVKDAETDKVELNGKEGAHQTNSVKPISYVSNFFTKIEIGVIVGSSSFITRDAELYFNFIINAREFDGYGNMMYNDYVVKSLNSTITDMNISEGRILEISDDELKAKMLDLIYFNETEVSKYDYSKFNIEVTNEAEYYMIKYTYKNSDVTYIKSFSMSKIEIFDSVKIVTNDYYQGSNEILVTYEDENGAWAGGKTFYLMDANNKAVYSAFKPIELNEVPEEDDINYYIKGANGVYTEAPWNDDYTKFEAGTYYIENEIYEHYQHYTFKIKVGNKEEVLTDINKSSEGLTFTIPSIISSVEGSAKVNFNIYNKMQTNIFARTWTIKVVPKDVIVNDCYINNQATLYQSANGAWNKDNVVTIMDSSNKGLYSAFKKVSLSAKPTDDSIKYYIKNNDGTYSVKTWGSADKFEAGIYYQLNDIVANYSQYKFMISIGSEQVAMTDLTYSSGTSIKLYATCAIDITDTTNVKLLVIDTTSDVKVFMGYWIIDVLLGIQANDKYTDNKTIVYKDRNGAWPEVNKLLVMDTSNVAMYQALDAVKLSSKPTSGKYYVKDEDGKYSVKTWAEGDEFVEGTYYIQNELFANASKYIIRIKTPTSTLGTSTFTKDQEEFTLTCSLSSVVYATTDITIEIVHTTTGVVVFEDTWEIIVYNLLVNDSYSKSMTIMFRDNTGAWGSGDKLIIMDANNKGLFARFEPVTLSKKPESGTYYTKDTNGTYSKVSWDNAEEFIAGTYYVNSDVFNNYSNYSFELKNDKGSVVYAGNNLEKSEECLAVKLIYSQLLPLLPGSTNVTLVITRRDLSAVVFEAEWLINIIKPIINDAYDDREIWRGSDTSTWTGSSILFMDEAGNGMYSVFEAVWLSKKPDNTVQYYEKDAEGNYNRITWSKVEFNAGTYYKLSDIYENYDRYMFKITSGEDVVEAEFTKDQGKLYVSNDLFTNFRGNDISISIINKKYKQTIFDDTWAIY